MYRTKQLPRLWDNDKTKEQKPKTLLEGFVLLYMERSG